MILTSLHVPRWSTFADYSFLQMPGIWRLMDPQFNIIVFFRSLQDTVIHFAARDLSTDVAVCRLYASKTLLSPRTLQIIRNSYIHQTTIDGDSINTGICG